MAKRTCSVDGCERPHGARGFCQKHYYAWQRSGKPWPKTKSRKCRHCGARFRPRSEAQWCCSERCVKRAFVGRQPKFALAMRKCEYCGEAFCPKQSTQLRCSERCTREIWKQRKREEHTGYPERSCDWCGQSYKPVSHRSRYCSPLCRNRSRDRQRARRWKIKRATIFDRDGWLCRICGQAVDQSLRHPHPRAATIDHILAVSRGGSDEASNLQTAHMDCNASKGDALWT